MKETKFKDYDRPTIGVCISPKYNLDSVFYYDYHRILEDLQRYCDILLAANVSLKPIYADKSLRLKYSSLLINNQYMWTLSHIHGFFNYIRSGFETMYYSYVSDKIANFFRKNKAKILYLLPRYPDSYIFRLRKKLSTKIVIEFWEDQIEHLYNTLSTRRISRKHSKLERKRGYRWLKNIVQLSDWIIVPTNTLKNRLMSLADCNGKVSVIPVCQDPLTPRDPSYVRLKHDIKFEKILFYLGSLSTYHDLKTVLLALSKVKSSNVVLLIAGGLTDRLIKKYNKLLINSKIPVIYLGRLKKSELEYYISAADICLGIYRFTEPSGFFPGSIIKFMLSGKPIIVTDLPEIREMFRNKKAGLLLEQENASQLTSAIDFLISNSEECLKMGKKAREIAQKNYLWKHHTNELTKIFYNLI